METLKIENLSPEKVTLEDGNIFNYGTLNVGDNSSINVRFSVKDLIEFSINSTCGCTIPQTQKQEDGSYIVNIVYDTKRLGDFVKTLTIAYTQAFQKKHESIKIKGTVK